MNSKNSFVVLLMLLFLGGCKGTKVYPLVEIGHDRPHDLKTLAGATFVTGKGNTYDVIGGYRWKVTDHEPKWTDKIQGEGPIVWIRFRGGSK